jgi:hypothetical protein
LARPKTVTLQAVTYSLRFAQSIAFYAMQIVCHFAERPHLLDIQAAQSQVD